MTAYKLLRDRGGIYVVHTGDMPRAWVSPGEDPASWFGREVGSPRVREFRFPFGAPKSERDAARQVAAMLLGGEVR
ncbi:hypothetical protein [Actinomadura rupiterrae]|uniref:hypothetical protein n=1 Tax=Actinomadura rupiterrae TaxID=559627 RepID=UPI0020A47F17|nr:hypothetical protein [Actinomadura rupiterrae]MCP2336131.1 hypothetical protein [Actinomadura rupiterrae]